MHFRLCIAYFFVILWFKWGCSAHFLYFIGEKSLRKFLEIILQTQQKRLVTDFMNKNTLTGILLIALVIIGFTWMSRPSEEEIARQQSLQDSIARVEQQKDSLKSQAIQTLSDVHALEVDSNSIFYEKRQGKGQKVVLENEKVAITLNTRGGVVEKAVIKGYKSRRVEGDVELITPETSKMSFRWEASHSVFDANDFVFTPVAQTDSTLTLLLGDDSRNVTFTYTLHPGSYMLDMKMSAKGMQGVLSDRLTINWNDRVQQQEKGYDFENRYSSLTYKTSGKGTDRLKETSNDEKQLDEELDWLAFKNQFFSAVIIGSEPLKNVSLKSTQEEDHKSGFLKPYDARMSTAFDATGARSATLQFYLGPNDFHILQKHNKLGLSSQDLDLEELVYLGWSLFRWINRWSILYIFDGLSALGLPMGVVLILLTIIVKLLVYPTTKKSFMSSAKMRVLKPQIDTLSAKYPKSEDAMKKQQEMMQIYSQYGVSPMGGCLPMLIQTPIWLALFNFIPNAIDLRGESFLWADDLSAYDDVIRWSKDIWLIGDHLSLFCVLFCLTNIINTWISMRQQKNQMMAEQAQQMKMMQYMMYIMPLMFFFMFNNYSSGLNFYYFLSGLTSVLIMWYLRKTTDDEKLLASLEAYKNSRKSATGKVSGMAARLEALQKMQEEQMKKRKK